MRREVVENVYRVYIWEIARPLSNKDLKKTLHVQFQADNGISQQLALTLTRTNFGGVRLWFLCPDCGRRVGTLYCPQQVSHFSCRHCHDCVFRSKVTSDSIPS